MITFDLVPLHRVFREIEPNIPRHYSEMTDGDEYGVPDIDWPTYLAMSQMDRCVVVTARDGEALVGYGVYSLGHNPRYKTRFEASSHGIFLEKPHRGKFSAAFLKKADEYLRKIGVRETHYILSDERVGKYLGRNGYKSKYKVWSVNYG
jgi:hypothetical protein